MAQDIFETVDQIPMSNFNLSALLKLSVIAFCSNGISAFNGDHKLKQLIFVRGKKLDPFEKAQMLAFQTKQELMQFVEPESDIVDHAAHSMSGDT